MLENMRTSIKLLLMNEWLNMLRNFEAALSLAVTLAAMPPAEMV